MTVMQCSRTEDQLSYTTTDNPQGVLDLSTLYGTWLNTNPASGGIAKVLLDHRDDVLRVGIFGVDAGGMRDWGEVTAEVYAKSVDAKDGMAFSAVYDFGFMLTRIQANVKQGVLVIASFTQFKDDSGRANYFVREFFHQE